MEWKDRDLMRRADTKSVFYYLLFLVVGCGPVEESDHTAFDTTHETVRQEVIYGIDNRMDVFEHPDGVLRAVARQATVALMSPGRIDASVPSNVRFNSPFLGTSRNLCSNQRFLADPTAAHCSGTLMDNDLVLTAGHCVRNTTDCANTRVVFNYYRTRTDALQNVTTADIFSCSSIVVRQEGMVNGQNLDYAIIRLDRPATPRFTPAPVRTLRGTPLGVGLPLAVIGSGSGIPFKIDSGGSVRDARAQVMDYFVANTDTFGGNSGSGVYGMGDYTLAGILVRGEQDYVSNGSCNVVNTCPEMGCRGEDITYVQPAIDDLCAAQDRPHFCPVLVGVIPVGNSCPVGTDTVRIHMDSEDNDDTSFAYGWTGGINVDGNGNPNFTFCRVAGDQFRSLHGANDGRSNYAVLKLSRTCPAGSVEFSRYFDTEDNNPSNSHVGPIFPNERNNNILLRFCLFKGDGPVGPFPALGFDYGVFASSYSFTFTTARGFVYTDDEDNGNDNGYFADASWKAAATAIVSEGGDTYLHTARAAFPTCGDGYCNGLETESNCAADCDICGNTTCGPTEDAVTCPFDCGFCGDGVCGAYEQSYGCEDCPYCGDGNCDYHENNWECPRDCEY